MNHYVPDFEMEDDYSIPAARARKSTMPPEDDIMELVWHDGRLVINSQTQRLGHKRSKYDAAIPEHTTPPAAPPPQQQQPENQPQLFMQEDEMATWLQYPLADDDSFCADLLYNNDSSNVQPNNQPPVSAPPPRPPVHPPPPMRRTELQNFLHFGRLNSNNNNNNNNNRSRYESSVAAPPRTRSVVRETTTVVDSSDTPLQAGPGSMFMDSGLDASNNNASPGISESGGGGGRGLAATASATTSVGAATAAASTGKDAVTCEISLTSPGGGSTSLSGSLSPEVPLPAAEDRKRKGREADEAECQSHEDVQFEPAGAKSGKKPCQGSTSTKRSRAAEVHNLSERRRRDRINEKMRCLQELIPRCNKSDKASMLDEAIEYLKSLQLQVQMMSMGCGMVPMMFPGVQQYMQMGMGMGMGMGVEMGMTQPIMPYGNVLAGSTMPTAPAGAHMRPRFPMPAYPMQTMLPNDPNRVQATNHSGHMSNLLVTQSQNQSRGPIADPYQQYITPQQMQMQLQQNQLMAQPSSSKPSSSMGTEVQESPQ